MRGVPEVADRRRGVAPAVTDVRPSARGTWPRTEAAPQCPADRGRRIGIGTSGRAAGTEEEGSRGETCSQQVEAAECARRREPPALDSIRPETPDRRGCGMWGCVFCCRRSMGLEEAERMAAELATAPIRHWGALVGTRLSRHRGATARTDPCGGRPARAKLQSRCGWSSSPLGMVLAAHALATQLVSMARQQRVVEERIVAVIVVDRMTAPPCCWRCL